MVFDTSPAFSSPDAVLSLLAHMTTTSAAATVRSFKERRRPSYEGHTRSKGFHETRPLSEFEMSSLALHGARTKPLDPTSFPSCPPRWATIGAYCRYFKSSEINGVGMDLGMDLAT